MTPAAPFRLPMYRNPDGVQRCERGVLRRLLHYQEEPVLACVANSGPGKIVFLGQGRTRQAASFAVERMRFALGVDVDVSPFLRRFAHDPLIGSSVRRRPWLRVQRRPQPFEALAWAICEQLIEYRRAAAIERRIVRRLGRWASCGGGGALGDLPTPSALAAVSPAFLQSLDLGGARARALVRASHEVAAGRIDLQGDHERCRLRLLAIDGIGMWTVEMLALHGQGQEEAIPAGDVGLLRFAGRSLSGGDPNAFAKEEEVRELFATYGPWAGLAAAHVLTP